MVLQTRGVLEEPLFAKVFDCFGLSIDEAVDLNHKFKVHESRKFINDRRQLRYVGVAIPIRIEVPGLRLDTLKQ